MLSGNGFAGPRTRDLTWIRLKRGLALCKGAERHGEEKKQKNQWELLTSSDHPVYVRAVWGFVLTFSEGKEWDRLPRTTPANTKAMRCAETKAIESNKHFKDWLSVCRCGWVAVLSQNSRLILTDSVSVTTDELHRCLSLSDRWAAKMRIFWIFLWMWSRTHQ